MKQRRKIKRRKRIRIRRPDDFHVHFRRGSVLWVVAPYTAWAFKRALVKPNTPIPIQTKADIEDYRSEIRRATAAYDFEPLMTVKLLETTTPAMIKAARRAGAVAGKLYPRGATTNADDGIRVKLIPTLRPVFKAMERCGMVLCLHAEDPSAFCIDREVAFIPILREIVAAFPKLRIVVEHVTTRAMVMAVRDLPDTVGATITVHHLMLTLDDVVGGKIKPHSFCKPLANRREDRAALRRAVISGDPKFFFGSDSAPHTKDTKECSEGCAGIFVPYALEHLVCLFEEWDALNRLEPFVSEFGARHYGLPLNEGTITLVREPTRIQRVTPRFTDPGSQRSRDMPPIIPFMVDQVLPWSIRES